MDYGELIYEGILESIPEAGGENTFGRYINYTILAIKINGELKHIRHDNIILPDSIKNKIQVYKNNYGGTNIYDVKLDRWYL